MRACKEIEVILTMARLGLRKKMLRSVQKVEAALDVSAS